MSEVTLGTIRNYHYAHIGWAMKEDEARVWFGRLTGLTDHQVDEALRQISETRRHTNNRSRITVTEVKQIASSIRAEPADAVDDREAPPICDCPRLCAYGIITMTDGQGYEFLAHCDCARGEFEARHGNKLARTGGAADPCGQMAVTGRGVAFYLSKGASIVERAEIRWSDRGRQWIDDETDRLQAEGIPRARARERATAAACHKRMQQRGGLLAGIGR